MRHAYKDVCPTDVGFSMGFDHVSEHEWGIKKMKGRLGIKPHENVMFADRVVTNTESIRYIERKNFFAVTMTSPYDYNNDEFDEKAFVKQYTIGPKNADWYRDGYASYWDENRFLLAGYGSEQARIVKELYDNLMAKNVVVLIDAKTTGHSGLNFVYLDKISKEKVDAYNEAIADDIRLNEESAKIGIPQKLIDAGKRYFACSPRWNKYPDKTSNYPVVYWLNPFDQQNNKYGLYTVEELEEWIEGKGPIPIVKK